MGRKAKYSKEKKIKACKDYMEGKGSFESIAKSVGCSGTTLLNWYYRYIEHGENVFNTSNRNKSYSKGYKISIVKQYIAGKYSFNDLSAKYNISSYVIGNWVNKYYNGIELKDYDPKGDVYTLKSRKATYKERLEIVKEVIENNMSYKDAAYKHSVTYALVYKWTKDYIAKGPDSLKQQKRGPKPKSKIDESKLTEVEKLKLELKKEKELRKIVEFELEVLKKKEEFEKKINSRK